MILTRNYKRYKIKNLKHNDKDFNRFFLGFKFYLFTKT